MKKRLIFLSSLLVVSAVSFLGYYIFTTSQSENKTEENIKKELIAEIDGAVEKPGNYFFIKNQTLRMILANAIIRQEADLSSILLNEKKDRNFSIYIPFIGGEQNKLFWKDIKSINQLINIGISKTIAKKLMDLKEKKENVEWSDIENISGIGDKTLAKLKKLIELA
ncbi:MAG: MAG0490 family ComEA-like DNA-binding protein [Metamycoplasmataceae bacterium]